TRNADLFGQVRAIGLTSGGQVNLTGVRIAAPPRTKAVVIQRSRVSAILMRGARCEGGISLLGSEVEGLVDLSGIHVGMHDSSPARTAILLDELRCSKLQIRGTRPDDPRLPLAEIRSYEEVPAKLGHRPV